MVTKVSKESEERRSLKGSIWVRRDCIKKIEGYIADLEEEIEGAGPEGRAEGEVIKAQLTWNLDQNKICLEREKKRLGGRDRGVEEENGEEEEVTLDGN